MKLPTISNKPTSSSSQRKSQNNVIYNLEQNLFNKLNEYDDLHKIEKNNTNELKRNSNLNPQKSYTMKQNIEIKSNSQTQIQPTIQQQVQQSNTKKIDLKIQQSVTSTTDNLFLTVEQNQQNGSSSSDSESDIEEQLQEKGMELKKQKKLMIDQQDDSELGQLNRMIFETQTQLDDQFQNIYTLKKTIDSVLELQKAGGHSINSELINNLNRQYKEMIQLQKETQILDEYSLQEYKTHRNHKMPSLRSGSVANQKKRPQQTLKKRTKDSNI